MKRLIVLLVLGLIVGVLLALFPSFAQQTLRIEAFGWVFETRQGAFLVALIVLALFWWLLRAIVTALLAGPGRVWEALAGGEGRKERRLREAIEGWINDDRTIPARLLRRARGIAPRWLLEALHRLSLPASEQRLDLEADPIVVAAAARAATDPHAPHRPDPAEQRAFLEAWLSRYPNAAVAEERLAQLALEQGDWDEALRLLERLQQQGAHARVRMAPMIARAYLGKAEQVPTHEAIAALRRALRVQPDCEEAALRLADLLMQQRDLDAALSVLLDLLSRRASMAAAEKALALGVDPMQLWRRFERRKENEMNPALRWLAAQAAHRAGLVGVARERMQRLAEEGHAPAWQALGEWALQAEKFEEAARAFARALQNAPERVYESERN